MKTIELTSTEEGVITYVLNEYCLNALIKLKGTGLGDIERENYEREKEAVVGIFKKIRCTLK